MKQVTIRHFQRYFCKLKGEKCQVLDGDGVIIGTYEPNNGLPMPVRHGLEAVTGKGMVNVPLWASAIPSDGHGVQESKEETSPCVFCKRPSNGQYTFWEDGEEQVASLCYPCARKKGVKLTG